MAQVVTGSTARERSEHLRSDVPLRPADQRWTRDRTALRRPARRRPVGRRPARGQLPRVPGATGSAAATGAAATGSRTTGSRTTGSRTTGAKAVRHRSSRRPLATFAVESVVALVCVLLLAARPGVAAGARAGYVGPSFDGVSETPTAAKPQSKLWFNDGAWWADMFDPRSRAWHIFRLDRSRETWVDTGTPIDDRINSRGDALWDGTHLYVAANVVARNSDKVTREPALLYRYSYLPADHRYVPDAGFPVPINNTSSESLTLDKDSRGVLWATWTAGRTVHVNATGGDDRSWGRPFVPAVPGVRNLKSDDISSLVAVGGSGVGLMWSDQHSWSFQFAYHRDGAPRTVWSSLPALDREGIADDHLDLADDGEGHLFAAVKTSMDAYGTPGDAQLLLLRLDIARRRWTSTVFGTVADCHTRPIVMIDRVDRVLHVLATAPTLHTCPHAGTPGAIFEKSTSLDHIAFPPGRGTRVIGGAGLGALNGVTSSKQGVTRETGLVVLAADDVTHRYWHADLRADR